MWHLEINNKGHKIQAQKQKFGKKELFLCLPNLSLRLKKWKKIFLWNFVTSFYIGNLSYFSMENQHTKIFSRIIQRQFFIRFSKYRLYINLKICYYGKRSSLWIIPFYFCLNSLKIWQTLRFIQRKLELWILKLALKKNLTRQIKKTHIHILLKDLFICMMQIWQF